MVQLSALNWTPGYLVYGHFQILDVWFSDIYFTECMPICLNYLPGC